MYSDINPWIRSKSPLCVDRLLFLGKKSDLSISKSGMSDISGHMGFLMEGGTVSRVEDGYGDWEERKGNTVRRDISSPHAGHRAWSCR
jgi:hypothetical protein